LFFFSLRISNHNKKGVFYFKEKKRRGGGDHLFFVRRLTAGNVERMAAAVDG
jgi:hypothetical protein